MSAVNDSFKHLTNIVVNCKQRHFTENERLIIGNVNHSLLLVERLFSAVKHYFQGSAPLFSSDNCS